MRSTSRPAILIVSLAALIGLSACPKKYHGKTKPDSDTAWHSCKLEPEKREKAGGGAGTLRYSVSCTAKEKLWIHDVEVVLYEGDKASNQGTKALLSEEEKIDLEPGKSGDRKGSFEVSDVNKPWVVKARIAFGYPGGFDVENMEADMEAHDKDKRDNPTKFRIELSAAFP